MNRRNWKRHLWTLLLAANLALIWGNSMLPGSQSQEVSDGFLRQFAFLPALLGENGPKLIRKIAHFA